MHVISTAGHVDHGKSTLIRQLTGIDPDRLAEEKERGLTIDLGFAWMSLPSGREVGIVDVPGHERFIHNMLAGVGPVTVTLFVVAANEGWRQQSEEHLAIVDLLGARAGVVALTKADLVDAETLEATREQVARRLEGTVLEGSEIVPVDAVTGVGCSGVIEALERALDRAGTPTERMRPRLFVDRCFSVHGVGTVVTGTLTGGTLRTEDVVTVLPSGIRSRVRAIQSHKRVLEQAEPVRRVAINLAGVDREQVRRGDAVVMPGQWQPTSEIDVELRTLATLDAPLTDRGAYKAYLGSAEVDARLHLLGDVAIGEACFARLTLSHPVVAAPHDRLILRDVGRRKTVAGGVVLDAHPPVLRGPARHARIEQLRRRATTAQDDFASLTVAERGVVPRVDLSWLSGTERAPDDTVSLRTLEVSQALFDALSDELERAVAAFHTREPLLPGMPRDEARDAAGIKNARLFNEMLDVLGHRVTADNTAVRLPGHRVVINLDADADRDLVLEQIAANGFQPPSMRSLIDTHGERLVRAMISEEQLVQVAEDIVFSAEQIAAAKQQVAEAIRANGPMTASAVRELLQTSRKFAIPLLEYLDGDGFTRRNGDVRDLAVQITTT